MEAQEVEYSYKDNTVQHECEYDKNKARYDSRLLCFDSLNNRLDTEHNGKYIKHSYQCSIEQHKNKSLSIVEPNTRIDPRTI